MKKLLLSMLLLSSSVALRASFAEPAADTKSFAVGQMVCIEGIQKKPGLINLSYSSALDAIDIPIPIPNKLIIGFKITG